MKIAIHIHNLFNNINNPTTSDNYSSTIKNLISCTTKILFYSNSLIFNQLLIMEALFVKLTNQS